METKPVRAGVHYKLVQPEADYPDYRKSGEFSPSVLEFALSEDPCGAEQVIADQAEDKRYCG